MVAFPLEPLGVVIVAGEEEHLRAHGERAEDLHRDGHAVFVEVDQWVVEHDEAAAALQVGLRHRQTHGKRQSTAPAVRQTVRRQRHRTTHHARRQLAVELERRRAARDP